MIKWKFIIAFHAKKVNKKGPSYLLFMKKCYNKDT